MSDHESAQEGELARERITLLENAYLKRVREWLKIIDHIALGRSITSNPQKPERMASRDPEAVMAAIFIDGGECDVREFIERFVIGDRTGASRPLMIKDREGPGSDPHRSSSELTVGIHDRSVK